MASSSFYLRPSSRKNFHFLNVQFVWQRGGDSKFRKSLGIEIPSNAWDKKKQRIRDIATASKYRGEVNKKLEGIEKWFESYVKSQSVIQKHLVKDAFNDFMNPSASLSAFTLTDFIKYFKKDLQYSCSIRVL